MRAGIIVYPGTSGAELVSLVLEKDYGVSTEIIWHEDKITEDFDLLILPGGASFGNYIRPGAIAAHSPISESIIEHAKKGKLIMGITNGFQILTELKLLPGAFLPNKNGKFISKNVQFINVNNATPFTCALNPGEVLTLPIAHHYGEYYLSAEESAALVMNQGVIFNSVETGNIVAVTNKEHNVFGIMAHPDRATDPLLGNVDGRKIFDSILKSRGDK